MTLGRKLARTLARRVADHFAIGSGYRPTVMADSTAHTADSTVWTADSG